MELKCSLQTYDWGKYGEKSEAALLGRANNPSLNISNETPYAEFWMGTHPNGPSRKASTDENLHEWILKNPEVLGESVKAHFGVELGLPFLFKVLSVKKALSIQVHPSKSQAEDLHKAFPHIYKDPNHKPEMAIALSTFEALCGFRPLDQIKSFLDRVPELRECVGEDNAEALKCCSEDNAEALKCCSEDRQQELLQKCFYSLMSAPETKVQTALNSLLARLTSLDESSREMHLAELVERLHSDFPGDVGVFGPYLFNHLCLQPGQAIFLPANEPHAYLSGDCVECMACSDNTIRAGLTPKFKDVPTLTHMLTYICEPPENKFFSSEAEDQYSSIFRPPVPDFAVAQIKVPTGQSYSMLPRQCASVSLVISGSAKSEALTLQRGSVFFLSADKTVSFTVDSPEPILIFQALANV